MKTVVWNTSKSSSLATALLDPKREKVGDTLAALANGRGGTFVLGVDDKTHEILGIPLARLDTAGRWIREICNDLIKPPLDNAGHSQGRTPQRRRRDRADHPRGCAP